MNVVLVGFVSLLVVDILLRVVLNWSCLKWLKKACSKGACRRLFRCHLPPFTALPAQQANGLFAISVGNFCFGAGAHFG